MWVVGDRDMGVTGLAEGLARACDCRKDLTSSRYYIKGEWTADSKSLPTAPRLATVAIIITIPWQRSSSSWITATVFFFLDHGRLRKECVAKIIEREIIGIE